MKALILAAGIGSRLAPLTDELPKSMIRINDKTILENQIEILQKNKVDDITVVTGYKGAIIEDFVNKKYDNIHIINNIDYLTTNNMYSAFLGKSEFEGQQFLMMNADVFFDYSVIEKLISYEKKNAIVVDIGNYLEESMKVIEKDHRLVEISKNVSQKDAFGTSIDVYKFSEEGSKAFFDKCNEYIIEKQELNKWSEVALNDILSEIYFSSCPLNGRWIEIDNINDLEYARGLFSNVWYI